MTPVPVGRSFGRRYGSRRGDGRLTMADLKTPPGSAPEIWEDQYATLRTEYTERRGVPWAVKLLATVNVPLYESLIEGVYTQVLGQDPFDFAPALARVVDQQWLLERRGGQAPPRYTSTT